jgi:hypothetical protein
MMNVCKDVILVLVVAAQEHRPTRLERAASLSVLQRAHTLWWLMTMRFIVRVAHVNAVKRMQCRSTGAPPVGRGRFRRAVPLQSSSASGSRDTTSLSARTSGRLQADVVEEVEGGGAAVCWGPAWKITLL